MSLKSQHAKLSAMLEQIQGDHLFAKERARIIGQLACLECQMAQRGPA